jgi:hypothetical protein
VASDIHLHLRRRARLIDNKVAAILFLPSQSSRYIAPRNILHSPCIDELQGYGDRTFASWHRFFGLEYIGIAIRLRQHSYAKVLEYQIF